MWPGVTPLSLVCLRFDDYHQDVDHKAWVEVLSEYDDRGLRGVVAVVPEYEGEQLSADVVPFLKRLEANGWEVAQHGYRHENVGRGRASQGLLGPLGRELYDERSEFAGLSYEEQERRIGAGKDVLEAHDLTPTTFIPPWHEYDRDTARALSEHGFTALNEGRWPIPRTVEGVTLVPTHLPAITPAMLSVGVTTIVGHPHLDDDPISGARIVSGHERRLRTPNEIADWWQTDSTLGSLVDSLSCVAPQA
jgi:peptidoglycan/xylan/chitin deacetylase (PgdA/CDA1 family)